MIERIENTAQDVHTSMMELELDIINDKKLIRDNNFDDHAALQFSANIFNLFVKRVKHGFFIKGEFEKGNKFEELLIQNSEAIGHAISANAMKALMNTMMYNVSPDDTFMELLKDYAEYLKPILSEVI
jgi:hypothetical protein